MSSRPVIVWFRSTLRLTDHPALVAAVESDSPVIPLYILDDHAPGRWKLGGARRWWLHHSLEALDGDLRARGSRLVLRRGQSASILPSLVEKTRAAAVFVTRSYEPWARKLEETLHTALAAHGVAMKRFSGNLLFEPDSIRTGGGEPYRVFTPFWRAASARELRRPLPPPRTVPPPAHLPQSDDLASWDLLPSNPDWASGMRETWTPGEAAAARHLDAFLDQSIGTYHLQRDRPALRGTSRLSPYLANGEISPHVCWHAAQARGTGAGVETFLKELTWREFSYHLLYHWPDLPETAFRKEFADFPWSARSKDLRAWQKGRTGYPFVDAGLRELWHTGWMHNRVRMAAASFLIKHLLVPWQEGEAWFWDTLVDADLANNAASWQWVAGSGADAAPYFRIFNPIKQGQTFDPKGDYVRRWVPEIAKLDGAHIHAPWLASQSALADAGVVLGKTYPMPIVDHDSARRKALAAFDSIRPRRKRGDDASSAAANSRSRARARR